jgi:hypothetical protein
MEGTHFTEKGKKERMSKSQLKARMIILFHIRGIIMAEWVHEGQTGNQK